MIFTNLKSISINQTDAPKSSKYKIYVQSLTAILTSVGAKSNLCQICVSLTKRAMIHSGEYKFVNV